MRVHVVVIRLMSASVMKDAATALAVLVRARMVESQTSVTLNLLAEKQTATALHPFNGVIFRTTWVSRYQKGKTSLDLNEARDDGILGWQWHQLWLSLQTDNLDNG